MHTHFLLLLKGNPKPHFIKQNSCKCKLMKYKLRAHTEADKGEKRTVICGGQKRILRGNLNHGGFCAS